MIFCLKERNARKISSYRWIFSALCKVLSPTVCIILDGGSMLSPTAIYELWKNVVFDDRVGCAISNSKAQNNMGIPGIIHAFKPLIGFQKFEHQLANMFQQPFETLTQLRSGVTRGGLFAYRLAALSGVEDDAENDSPLNHYYDIEKARLGSNAEQRSLFYLNRGLVEEKILSWALLTSRRGWKTILVNTATVSTEVLEHMPEFLLQRRRWINGSFCGSFQELFSLNQIQWRKRNVVDWIRLSIAFTFQALDLLMKWFAIVRDVRVLALTKLMGGREIS
jgi:chitin synthase